MFLHGWKPSVMFDSEIPALWFIIFCQILILIQDLIMHLFKSIPLEVSIAFKTSCLETGPGIRQYTKFSYYLFTSVLMFIVLLGFDC